jgi:hypothetical protein
MSRTLAGLVSLKKLQLANTQVKDVSPLTGLDALTY